MNRETNPKAWWAVNVFNLIMGVACALIGLLALSAGDTAWSLVFGVGAILNIYFWLGR